MKRKNLAANLPAWTALAVAVVLASQHYSLQLLADGESFTYRLQKSFSM